MLEWTQLTAEFRRRFKEMHEPSRFREKIYRLFKKFQNRFCLDAPTREFINHNKKKYGGANARREKTSVILLDFFEWHSDQYCFSRIANFLADRTNSRLESFSFTDGFLSFFGLGRRRLEKIYASFGAPLSLTFISGYKYWKESKRFSENVFATLKTKDDVLKLKIDNICVGPLIYDSYIQASKIPTADISDPLLKLMIRYAYVIYFTSVDYFRSRVVKAIFVGHTVSIWYGIVVRVARQFDVPIFTVLNSNDLLITDIQSDNFYHLHFREYPKVFSSFDNDFKPLYRTEARNILMRRFAGDLNTGIADNAGKGRTGLSGYGPVSSTRLMAETGRPRVLVMMNCLFDAPHAYGDLLLPDLFEWLIFILENASNTPFDWYVKPHPAGYPQNDQCVEELKKRFPKLHFLNRTSSNAQLIREGICSLFTTFGSAAHEFAYFGVPVVTAGENPHIAYNFNIHAKSRDELAKLVSNADSLALKIDQREIEEFFYMHYCYSNRRTNSFEARCIEEHAEDSRVVDLSSSMLLRRYIRDETPEQEKRLQRYLNDYFNNFQTLTQKGT